MTTPSDPRTQILDDYLDLRDSLHAQRIGRGGLEVSAELTATLDRAIAEIATSLPEGVAVVALGGYGRQELSPYSDVDLMLLHEVEDPADAAAELFRPLWDAKLRVGHAVRTLKETSVAARERFDTQTTLLTSRLVAGDESLFDGLTAQVAAATRARPLRRHLVAAERERRERTPFLLMATNVKTGRGGLRTLQGFDWERRREELIGRFSADSRIEEREALERLVQIRNALHVAAGRSHDVYSPELREHVAGWLGVDVFESATWLVDAIQTVDRLATLRWPEVTESAGPARRRVWSRASGSTPTLRTDQVPTLEDFVSILSSGESGRIVFGRLWEGGLLDDILPEWGVVASLPQLAPFHEHPVAAHLWRTVSEMQRLIGDGGPHQEMEAELARPGLTLLAAFLHDIGKGHGGDHAEVGAVIVDRFCRRSSVPAEWSDLLTGAVRHHLLLAETATRRDLDDPAVIDEVANVLGSLAQLQILYLLTIADSRATGTGMWSEWKATLLRTLFTRCRARLSADSPVVGPASSREAVLEAVGDDRRAAAAAHIDAMPGDYLRSTSTADVIWHLDMIESLEGVSAVEVKLGAPVDTAVVVGLDRGDFRKRVAESFAANGIDVLEARLHTRSDGHVVDSFQVRDDRTGDSVSTERWERARRDIEAAARGELDTVAKVTARARAYESQAPPGGKPRVECAVDSATGDVVVAVKCTDRVGRLAEILAALSDCGLEVRLAKLDTRGAEVIDTFHVRRGEAHFDESMSGLEHLIAAGISP